MKKMLNIFNYLKSFFNGPDLESEEFTKQTRKQEVQGIQILAHTKCLVDYHFFLSQLNAENISARLSTRHKNGGNLYQH